MDWSELAADLASRAQALQDGHVLHLTVDSAVVQPMVVRPPRWFGTIKAKRVRTLPEVWVDRQEDHLRVECTGDATFGGPIPLTPEALAVMRGLGWHPGGGPEGTRWTRFWPDDVALGPWPPAGAAQAAAAMVTETLSAVFGVEDAAGVGLEGPTPPPAGAPSNRR